MYPFAEYRKAFSPPIRMCGTMNPINVRGVPCALKPHLNEGVSRKVLGSLSQYGCQWSFLDWVKTFRRDAPDIEEEELLMCPMLWCRNTFKDVDATVRHTFECPRLSNGWYWCPYCKRPERFLECDKACDFIPRPRLQKRETKLAVTFFKWLGRKRFLKKIVVTPGKVELEDTARDERIRRGSYKGELGKGRQTIAFDTKELDLCVPSVGQGYSHADKLKTRNDAAHAELVNEKAKYPGNRSGAAEVAGDVSRSELSSPQRVNLLSLQEMSGSTSFDTAEAGNNSIDYNKLDPQAFVTPPLIDLFVTSASTNLELPSVDPVYWTAELRDRTSFNIDNAHTATSFTTSQDQQADSGYGISIPGADTLEKSFNRFSHLLDEQGTPSLLDDYHEQISDIHPSMPSLRSDFPVPQTTSPSTPSPSLISQLSSALSLSSRISALISPMSNVGSPTPQVRQVPGVSGIAILEDDINAWRSRLSRLPPPTTLKSQLQTGLVKLNTILASDSSRYHWLSSSERRQIPFQIGTLGTEANHDHEPHLGGNPAGMRTQVEDLRELVCIVNNEWMQRLLPSPELYARCSSLSTRMLFAKGINTLKTWLCGKLERTFEEVFSFMHIAFAAAFILHHEDESYDWNAFYQDALQLQHALVNREGDILFLTAMDRWWWLPGLQIPSSNANPHSSIRNTSRECSIGSDQATLLQILRNSKVFRVCVGFLDGLEEAVIMERNISFPGAAVAAQTNFPKIGDLVEKIIRPLEQEKGIEAFQALLADASFGICGGALRDIREVEVVLVSSGRWSSQSPKVFERFEKSVTTQCNTAMGSSNRVWRNQYYIADLKDIMDVSEELESHEGLDFASRHWQDTSVHAVIRPSGISLGSPTSLSSGSTGTFTVGFSPTSLTTPTSMDMSPKDEVSTEMTSPTTASQTSTTPTSPAGNSSKSVVICQICGDRFTGTLSDARSNLTRHLRTSPKHNKDVGFKCPERTCAAKPMRADNLGPHLKRRHGLTSPLELEQAVKKSRGLNTVPEKA